MQKKCRYFVNDLLIFFIFLLGIWIQANIFFNGDTSWLMHAGAMLLQGGSYFHDFFDVNTPMAIFVYLPAVLLTKITAISFIVSLPIYVFCLAFFSLVICSVIIKIIFEEKSSLIAKYFLVAIAFVYILLPASQFGQREQLLIILTTPYLLLIVARCQNKLDPALRFIPRAQSNQSMLALGVGLAAGIGFSIKPYFLLLWVAIEFYLICTQKKISFRLEFLAVLFVLFAYGWAIFLFTPEYVTQVLPIIWHFYYFIFSYSWVAVLTRPLAVFCLLVVIFYGVLRKQFTNTQLADVFALGIIACLLIYISQRAILYYRLLPALSLAAFLLFFLLCDQLENIIFPAILKLKKKVVKLVIVGCTVFTFLAIPIMTAYYQSFLAFTSQKRVERIQLIQMVKRYAKGRPTAFFTDQISDIYPVVDYARVSSASRFPGIWLIDSLYAFAQIADDQKKKNLLTTTKKFVLNAVWEDLQRYQPSLIFVQRQGPGWDYLHIKVDYLAFFAQDPRFQQFWRGYSYLGRVGFYDLYLRLV